MPKPTPAFFLSLLNQKRRSSRPSFEIIEGKSPEGNSNYFDEMFRNTTEAAMVSEMDTFKILEVNQACADLHGYTREEFRQLSLLDISSDKNLVINANRVFKGGNVPGNLYRVNVSKTGALIPIMLTGGLRFSWAGHDLIFSTFKTAPERSDFFLNGEKAFRALIENSSDIIIVCDENGIERYVSPSVERILGYSAEEWLGRSQYQLHHPEDRDRVRAQYFDLAKKPGQTLTFDWRFLHKDGTWRHVEAVASNQLDNPAINGIIINLRDITMSRLLEDRLRRSEAWFRSVMDNVYDLILLVDEQAVPLYLSPSFHRHTGYNRQHFRDTGNSMFHYLHPDDLTKAKREFNDLTSVPGATGTTEFRFRHADGSYRVFELRATNNLHSESIKAVVQSVRDITERKAAELQVESDLSMYRTVMESTAEGMVAIDLNGRILSYNKNFARMWHIDEAVMQAGRLDAAIVAALKSLKNSERVVAAIRHFGMHPQESGVMLAEFSDGTVLEANTKPQILEGKIIGRIWSHRDVTARMTSEKNRSTALQTYKLLTNISRRFITDDLESAITFSLCETGRFTDADRSFVFRFDESRTRFICTHEWTRNPETTGMAAFRNYLPVSVLQNTMDRIMAGEVLNIKGSGTPPPEAEKDRAFMETLSKFYSVLITPIRFAGQVIGFIGLDTNGREKDWREEDLQVLQLAGEIQANAMARSEAEEGLRKAKEAAEAATLAKSEFLANMSHEIRTPMNAILGFSELLAERIKDPQNVSYIQNISSSGKNLLGLINDILDLSKIEAGRLEIRNEPVSLKALLQELQSVFYVRTTEKGLSFRLEIDPALPDYLLIDEVRLRQILFNLVGNAIKFTDSGSICVAVKSKGINTEYNTTDLLFEVEDSGIGIPENELDLIFESFRQQSGQSSRKFGGTGLGLAITRRLAEMMGGSVGVESILGKGSLFRVSLDGIALADPFSPMPHTAQRTGIYNFSPATILLADDIAMNRQLIQEYLQNENITLIQASGGQQAIELAHKHKPDLIILDIKMPGMDGYEAVRIIKTDFVLHSIPVLALTAQAMKEDRQRIASSGFDGYLAKPVSRTGLLAELARFLPNTISSETMNEFLAEQATHTVILPNELLEKLETEGMQRWQEVSKRFIVTKVEGFAQYLLMLAEEHHHVALEKYAADMRRQAADFDMDRLPDTLARFPDFAHRLKEEKLQVK
ncbi:MAG: PAS domain S-box protein [Bacteroidota bacterium]